MLYGLESKNSLSFVHLYEVPTMQRDTIVEAKQAIAVHVPLMQCDLICFAVSLKKLLQLLFEDIFY